MCHQEGGITFKIWHQSYNYNPKNSGELCWSEDYLATACDSKARIFSPGGSLLAQLVSCHLNLIMKKMFWVLDSLMVIVKMVPMMLMMVRLIRRGMKQPSSPLPSAQMGSFWWLVAKTAFAGCYIITFLAEQEFWRMCYKRRLWQADDGWRCSQKWEHARWLACNSFKSGSTLGDLIANSYFSQAQAKSGNMPGD